MNKEQIDQLLLEDKDASQVLADKFARESKLTIFSIIGITIVMVIAYCASLKDEVEIRAQQEKNHASKCSKYDSVIRSQRAQIDTLIWYNDMGYKLNAK